MPHLEHKEPVSKPHEDNLTHEQQRFAIPKPAFAPTPAPVAPSPVKEQTPELEEFLVAVPPKAERPRPFGGYASAPKILEDEPRSFFAERKSAPAARPLPSELMRQEMREPEPEPAPEIPQETAPEPPREPEKQILDPLDTGARVIGECFQTYIIAEDKEGLILIDKHAAHERILFNKLRAETVMPQQELLAPVVVELTGEEAAAIQAQIEEVRQAGFAIDPFGENSFAVRSVPAYLDSGDVQSVIGELAEKLMNSRAAVPDRLDDLIHTVACKAAIKAGRATTLTELQDLCDRVLADDNVRSCPHGRPTTVRLTKYELDKLFKRVNQ